jgi:hypothetical protein
MIMKHQRFVLGAIAMVGICSAAAVLAVNFQLIQVTSSDIQEASWRSSSITWHVNQTPTPSNVDTSGGGTIAGALTNGFTAWSSATYNSLQVNTLSFTQGSDSTQTAHVSSDCVNVVGFTESLGTGIIAQTFVAAVFHSPGGFFYNCTTAPLVRSCPNEVCIVDADIEFNPNYNFATYPPHTR